MFVKIKDIDELTIEQITDIGANLMRQHSYWSWRIGYFLCEVEKRWGKEELRKSYRVWETVVSKARLRNFKTGCAFFTREIIEHYNLENLSFDTAYAIMSTIRRKYSAELETRQPIALLELAAAGASQNKMKEACGLVSTQNGSINLNGMTVSIDADLVDLVEKRHHALKKNRSEYIRNLICKDLRSCGLLAS
jgi:hypothetical protein